MGVICLKSQTSNAGTVQCRCPDCRSRREFMDHKGVTLICHECNREFDDPHVLPIRAIGGTHMCVSCPSCNRDLALLQIWAP